MKGERVYVAQGSRLQVVHSAHESWRKVKEAGSPQKTVKVVLTLLGGSRCQVDTEATPKKET